MPCLTVILGYLQQIWIELVHRYGIATNASWNNGLLISVDGCCSIRSMEHEVRVCLPENALHSAAIFAAVCTWLCFLSEAPPQTSRHGQTGVRCSTFSLSKTTVAGRSRRQSCETGHWKFGANRCVNKEAFIQLKHAKPQASKLQLAGCWQLSSTARNQHSMVFLRQCSPRYSCCRILHVFC